MYIYYYIKVKELYKNGGLYYLKHKLLFYDVKYYIFNLVNI